MNYCLFQGTFNPIHNAHLRIAEFALKKYNLDKIIFVPAFEPPHKETDPNLAEHRYNMVKLAIKDISAFDISDVEFKRGGKSYTYLTIKELYNKLKPDSKFKFIIGTDAFEKIESWYETEKLKELVDFIVFVRENNFNIECLDWLKTEGFNFEIMKLKFKDISSTDIRIKIKNGQSVEKLLPKAVEEYIKNYELYKY